MATDFTKAEKAIKEAKLILVATHRDPDGDAIGSLIAMGLYLKKIGKKPYLFSVSKPSGMYEFMPGFKLINSNIPKNKFDMVMGLDFGSRDRLGLEDYFRKYNPVFLGFDHHPAEGIQPKISVLDVSSAACSLMLYEYFRTVGFKLNKDMASALIVGILTDTGFLKYARSPKVFEAVMNLMKFGLTVPQFDNALYGHQRIEAVRVTGKIAERVQYNTAGKFNYSYVLLKDLEGIEIDEVAGVMDRIRNIGRGDFSLLLIQDHGNIWRGRLRSRDDQRYDVSALAKKFGGNGHSQAAGFRIKGKIDDILKTVAKYASKSK